MNEFEHIAETVGKDTLAVVEFPFKRTAEFVTVINTAIKDATPVKAAVIDLVKQAEGLIADGADDVSEKGLNLPEDLQTWKDVQAFIDYLKGTFFPLVASIYTEVAAEVKQ